MTDLTETVTEVVPALGKKMIYFTATKAAQNDTITFSDYTTVRWAAAMVNDGSNDWSADTVTVDASTANMINLTGATTGTIYGVAIVEE